MRLTACVFAPLLCLAAWMCELCCLAQCDVANCPSLLNSAYSPLRFASCQLRILKVSGPFLSNGSDCDVPANALQHCDAAPTCLGIVVNRQCGTFSLLLQPDGGRRFYEENCGVASPSEVVVVNQARLNALMSCASSTFTYEGLPGTKSRYAYSTDVVVATRAGAAAACRANGAKLVEFESVAEMRLIQTFGLRSFFVGIDAIGDTRVGNINNWVWSYTRTLANNANLWVPGEPDGLGMPDQTVYLWDVQKGLDDYNYPTMPYLCECQNPIVAPVNDPAATPAPCPSLTQTLAYPRAIVAACHLRVLLRNSLPHGLGALGVGGGCLVSAQVFAQCDATPRCVGIVADAPSATAWLLVAPSQPVAGRRFYEENCNLAATHDAFVNRDRLTRLLSCDASVFNLTGLAGSNTRYAFNATPTSRDGASKGCQNLGGKLVEFGSVAEQNLTIAFGLPSYHVGVEAIGDTTTVGNLNNWRWSDSGELANDPKLWAAGKPDGVQANQTIYMGHAIKGFDDSVATDRPYLCECQDPLVTFYVV